MFKENKRLAASDTLIGQGTSFEGKLTSEAPIRIEGECFGDIDCQSEVIIGECGVANSNITAREVIVSGKVYGDVATGGRLTITASGQLYGNIAAQTLLIQDGGLFSGSCRMERASADAKSKAAEGGYKQQGGAQDTAEKQAV